MAALYRQAKRGPEMLVADESGGAYRLSEQGVGVDLGRDSKDGLYTLHMTWQEARYLARKLYTFAMEYAHTPRERDASRSSGPYAETREWQRVVNEGLNAIDAAIDAELTKKGEH